MGAEQQARIMSELPNNLEGLHQQVKRYNGKNDETFFEELSVYIEEEKIRRQLTLERPGELFFFYKADYIVVTEELSKIHLTSDNFTGIPNLLRQLRRRIKIEISRTIAKGTGDFGKVCKCWGWYSREVILSS